MISSALITFIVLEYLFGYRLPEVFDFHFILNDDHHGPIPVLETVVDLSILEYRPSANSSYFWSLAFGTGVLLLGLTAIMSIQRGQFYDPS
jgi:hypothetical protein